ncbi:MAG: dihydroneopterin aldolase [Cyanobacteria bacterium K_DeepCast_35m_m2_023]|nr:dihydroneopterin aldolase [Cyanobacteria bacterium K_DeepCast_35m_m2_023]
MDDGIEQRDSLRISGIRGYGYTGVLPEEQSLGQWFEVDLCIDLDLSRCGSSDDLSLGLDYATVVSQVKTLLETARCCTIERLNTLICEAVLALAPVRGVESTLTKVAAPIPGFDGRVAVRMRRSRPA